MTPANVALVDLKPGFYQVQRVEAYCRYDACRCAGNQMLPRTCLARLRHLLQRVACDQATLRCRHNFLEYDRQELEEQEMQHSLRDGL